MDRFRSMPCCLAILAAACLLAPHAFAQPGALDVSFGNGGVVMLGDIGVSGITTQPDGRIVVVGSAPSTKYGTQAALWRYFSDGTPDLAFGDVGFAMLEPYVPPGWPFESYAYFAGSSVSVLPSGGFVAVGHGHTLNASIGVGWRVRPDGAPDTTFKTGGLMNAVVARPDGRYVVIGGDSGSDDGSGQFCGARQYRPDGTPDPTFGAEGFVMLRPDAYVSCRGTALLGDGRLVVFMELFDWNARTLNWGVARLLEDGTLDPTFGDGGMALVPLDLYAGAVAADGALLLGGSGQGYSYTNYPRLVRLTAGGELDTSLGEAGIATLDALGEGAVRGLVVLPDGGAVLTGHFTDHPHAIATRVLADGALDPTFGEGGVVTLNLGFDVAPASVVLDSEGRIVVAGSGNWAGTAGKAFIARFQSDGAVAAEPPATATLALDAPSPNPTSARASLTYRLAEPAPVRLAVYDALGREVAVLVDGTHGAGAHTATLDAARLAPGLYLVRLGAGGEAATRSLTVAR